MEADKRAAVLLLGWTEDSWNLGEDNSPFEIAWGELGEARQEAARRLGMEEEKWRAPPPAAPEPEPADEEAKAMAQRRYCKTCKVEFAGAKCPAGHPPIMYTVSPPQYLMLDVQKNGELKAWGSEEEGKGVIVSGKGSKIA